MKNVYEEVRLFYEEDIEWEPIISREWIEGYMRQKAWQGTNDAELKDLWFNLEMFLLYLIHSETDLLEDITLKEYSLAIEWMEIHIPDFKSEYKTVKHLFEVLIDFYHYLYSKSYIAEMDEIKRAEKEIVGNNELRLVSHNSMLSEMGLLAEMMDGSANNSDNLSRIVGDTVERLMVKIGGFFQQEQYSSDFDRALYLYTGPFDNVPEDEQDEFWLGFWDYFLFDYHLIKTDDNPLIHFFNIHENELNSNERQIMQDLLQAKFMVFYINKVIDKDWVECINLFTGELLQLPYPDFHFKSLKRILFYGHIYSQGVVMLNYVTSIEVSPNLRQRIKDEVIRQKNIFEVQTPDITLDDFFQRHALVVRHTIDVLVTLAKVNVTSAYQIDRVYPPIVTHCEPNQDVARLINSLAQEYGYSSYDIGLVSKLWSDFCQLTTVTVRKPATWASAVIYAYSQINGTDDILPEELADSVGVSVSSLKSNRNKLFEVLQLQKFDPRYLSEEGFVLSLFVL